MNWSLSLHAGTLECVWILMSGREFNSILISVKPKTKESKISEKRVKASTERVLKTQNKFLIDYSLTVKEEPL